MNAQQIREFADRITQMLKEELDDLLKRNGWNKYPWDCSKCTKQNSCTISQTTDNPCNEFDRIAK